MAVAATKLLIVVSRQQSSLYQHLKREFADVKDVVEIVLDRRHSERRRLPAAVTEDRRSRDRRVRPVAEPLLRYGWVTIRTHAGSSVTPFRAAEVRARSG